MSDETRRLLEKFSRISALMMRFQIHSRLRCGPAADLHRGQGRVLALLKMRPELSQKEIAYLLDMRAQSLGELLSKLERQGYITRTPLETDRRVMMATLTAAGEEAIEQAQEEERGERLFDFLAPQEEAQLENLLDKILEGLKEKTEAQGGPRDFRNMWRDGEGFAGFGGHGFRAAECDFSAPFEAESEQKPDEVSEPQK